MSFVPRKGNYLRFKNGRPYYRRQIPEKFRVFYGGKREWLIRLKGQTAYEIELEAKALAHQHNEDLADYEAMDTHERKWLVDQIKASEQGNCVADTSGEVRNGPCFYVDGEVRRNLSWAVSSDLTSVSNAEKAGYFSMTEEEAKSRLELAQIILSKDKQLSEMERELLELRQFKASTHLEQAVAEKNGLTISQAIKKWHDRDRQSLKTRQHHIQYLNEFISEFGDLYVSEITKRQVVDFTEACQLRQKKDGTRLAPSSVAKRLECIKSFLSFAESVDLVPHNVARGVKAPKDKRPRALRSWASFSKEDVRKIFDKAPAIWDSRKGFEKTRKSTDLKTALHLLAWTGARPQEVCQLRTQDLDLMKGVILITTDLGDDLEGIKPRSLKNESSIREVPIHSRLLPVIDSHLESLSGSNTPLFFPTFQPKGNEGSYCRQLSDEWRDHIRKPTGIIEPRKVMYSFRHSWSAESRRVGMPEHVRNAIMGHVNENRIADRYGGDGDWIDEKKLHIEKMECVPA